MMMLRLHAIQLRHRLCHDDDKYFAANMVGRIMFLSAGFVSIIVVTGILSAGESLLSPIIFFIFGFLLIAGLFLFLYSHTRAAEQAYFYRQYRALSTSINMLNPGRDHHDKPIVIDSIVKQWIPIPLSQDRKKAFIYAGIPPEEALTEPMTSWTLDDINVYAALNRESLSC